MRYLPHHVVASSQEGYELLDEEIFPRISNHLRLLKLPLSRQDEYVVIRPFWSDIDPPLVPQKYSVAQDINDMLLAQGLPTTIVYASVTDHGNATIKKDGVLAAWRRSPATQRDRLSGFCYMPGGELIINGLLNTYLDVSVKAVEGPPDAINVMLEHITRYICNGRVEYATYLVQWLAHMIQRPAERPGTGIAVIGEQGTGKGLFIEFIKKILGGARNANTTASSSDTKNFNYALGNKLFVVFDEATFAGDRQQADFMKKLVTEPRIRVEQKGLDAYEVDNFARVFITSNNMQSAVPAALGDRRWLVIECKDFVPQEFITELVAYVADDANASYFKHYLETLPLEDFNAKQVPIQNTGFENKLQGAYKNNPIIGFLWDWLTSPELTLYLRDRVREDGVVYENEHAIKWERRVLFTWVFELLQQACEANFATCPGRSRVGALLAPYGFTVVRRGQGTRYLQMPHPSALLRKLKRTSRFDWPITSQQEKYIESLFVTGTLESVGSLIMRDLTDEEREEQEQRWAAEQEREAEDKEQEKIAAILDLDRLFNIKVDDEP